MLRIKLRFWSNDILAEEIVVHSNKEQEKDREKFIDKSTGIEMEQSAEPQSLLEWFAEKYKDFGANLEVCLNKQSRPLLSDAGPVRYQ